MKNFFYVGVIIGAAILGGCSSGENREVVAPPKAPNDPTMSGQAKTAAETGIKNATVEQQIRKTGILPNGQHVPHS